MNGLTNPKSGSVTMNHHPIHKISNSRPEIFYKGTDKY